jgi:hypothetical protein
MDRFIQALAAAKSGVPGGGAPMGPGMMPGMGGGMMPPGGPPGMMPGMPGMGAPGMGGGMPQGMGVPRPPMMQGPPGGMPGQPFPPGGGNAISQGINQVCNILATQVAPLLDPMGEQALRLQNCLRELQAIAMPTGMPHPIGPGPVAPGMGPGSEGLHPLLRGLPDVPPPAAPGTSGGGGEPIT